MPKTIQPANANALFDRALGYVARYACTQARLRRYLTDRLRRMETALDPDQRTLLVDDIVARVQALGALDDEAFAFARAQTLTRRGQGRMRVRQKLAVDGVPRALADQASGAVDPFEAAVRLMQRRRLGPFSVDGPPADPDRLRQALGVMARGGHSIDLSRRLLQYADAVTLEALLADLRA